MVPLATFDVSYDTVIMRVIVVFLFLFFSLTNAFIVPIQRTHPVDAINRFATCHYGTSDKDEQVDNIIPSNNDDNDNSGGERKPLTTRRIGGRSSAAPSRDEPRGWLFLAVPVVAVWLLFQNLFGGPYSDFVYYESSVYESRVIGEGGKVETARKESVRTNIPGLVEGRGKDEQRMLRQSDDFDRAMDRELKNMFDDFF